MLIEVLVKGLEEWAEFRGVEGPEIAAAERQLQLGRSGWQREEMLSLGVRGWGWGSWSVEDHPSQLELQSGRDRTLAQSRAGRMCVWWGETTQRLSPFTFHLLALPPMDQTHAEA